ATVRPATVSRSTSADSKTGQAGASTFISRTSVSASGWCIASGSDHRDRPRSQVGEAHVGRAARVERDGAERRIELAQRPRIGPACTAPVSAAISYILHGIARNNQMGGRSGRDREQRPRLAAGCPGACGLGLSVVTSESDQTVEQLTGVLIRALRALGVAG